MRLPLPSVTSWKMYGRPFVAEVHDACSRRPARPRRRPSVRRSLAGRRRRRARAARAAGRDGRRARRRSTGAGVAGWLRASASPRDHRHAKRIVSARARHRMRGIALFVLRIYGQVLVVQKSFTSLTQIESQPWVLLVQQLGSLPLLRDLGHAGRAAVGELDAGGALIVGAGRDHDHVRRRLGHVLQRLGHVGDAHRHVLSAAAAAATTADPAAAAAAPPPPDDIAMSSVPLPPVAGGEPPEPSSQKPWRQTNPLGHGSGADGVAGEAEVLQLRRVAPGRQRHRQGHHALHRVSPPACCSSLLWLRLVTQAKVPAHHAHLFGDAGPDEVEQALGRRLAPVGRPSAATRRAQSRGRRQGVANADRSVELVAWSQTAASSVRIPFSRIFLPTAMTCSSCRAGSARLRPATVALQLRRRRRRRALGVVDERHRGVEDVADSAAGGAPPAATGARDVSSALLRPSSNTCSVSRGAHRRAARRAATPAPAPGRRRCRGHDRLCAARCARTPRAWRRRASSSRTSAPWRTSADPRLRWRPCG